MNFNIAQLTWTTVLVLAIGTVAAWQLAPSGPPAKVVLSAPDSWSLPDSAKPDTAKSVKLITERNLWGAVAAAVPTSLNTPDWRFVGHVVGPDPQVLISIDKKPATPYKPGDLLPGGAKLLSIADDRMCIEIEGKKRALGYY